MPDFLGTASAEEFCLLCREGRLFEAEVRLKAGKPSDYQHKNIRKPARP